MEIMDSAEAKQLIKLNENFLKIAEATNSVKDDKKALKLCLKLIKYELKQLKGAKQPVNNENSEKVLKGYDELCNTVKLLSKTKNLQDINKYYSEIVNAIEDTKMRIAELKSASFVGTITATSQKIATTISDTAQKIGDAVGDKIDSLKKFFATDDDTKN